MPKTWNIASAIHYLELHAGTTSTGNCGRFVNNALILGGGLNVKRGHPKDMGKHLIDAGFHDTGHPTWYEPGDIVIVNHGPTGHIAMWTGRNWLSDFAPSTTTRTFGLKGVDLYNLRYTIYRPFEIPNSPKTFPFL